MVQVRPINNLKLYGIARVMTGQLFFIIALLYAPAEIKTLYQNLY